MRNDPMEQKLKTAAEHLTPDVLDRILADCAKEPKGEILYMENISDPRSRNNNWIKVLSLGTAACMMIGGLFWWNRYRALNYTVEMDVNPSIELRVNKAEKVISAEALNKDAQIILEDMKLKGVDVDVATNAIIGSMVKNGYLSELSNSILLTVESDDHQKSVEVTDRLTNEINAALDSFGGSVIAQQVVSDNDLQNMAGDYGISEGKAALIRNILNELPMLKAEDLAEMSINDLNLLASSKQIALSNTTTTGSASESGYIGTARAEEIALEHAGITSADTDFINTELDCDGGIMEYEVEFLAGGVEYEYSINARTGQVLGYEYELSSGGSVSAGGNYITAQEARQAALDDAGLTESEVTFIKTKLDQDNGSMVYDIEFYTASQEYDYEIDALTGKVLSVDNEIGGFTAQTQTGSYISAEEAKAKVLEHLGMDASEVTFKKVELDYDDGMMQYEIELYTADREYDYDLNAQDGSILSWDFEALKAWNQGGSGSTAAAAAIDSETARSKALAHAGLSTATFTKTELDYDDGRAEYEIEFYTADSEYEYKIDGTTGAVLESKQEARQTSGGSNTISEADAKRIALERVGLTAADYVKVDYDQDDNEYEVEMRSGNTEYEVKISGSTGAVLEYDSETDD